MTKTLAEWLEYQQRVHPRGIALGLERVRAVAQRLRLARPARTLITVAGTNGKGSTVAFIEAIARTAGWRVGAYTSPHLLRYNERVRIDGREADDATLIAAFEEIEAARGEIPLTYFEFGTLAALRLFERADLDLAVLEVGLGGRLDAVNLIDADVAIVTSIGLDHTEWLGLDRAAIAREKAGIARAGRPVVIAERAPVPALLDEVVRLGARPVRAGIDFHAESRDEAQWRYRDAELDLRLPRPALAAPVQMDNAAAAIAALRQLAVPSSPLSERLPALDAAAIATGVAQAHVPARLQCFPGAVEIVVDVAHNAEAAAELARWLYARPVAGRVHAVFSALADKDLTGIAMALRGAVAHWWLAGLRDCSERGLAVEAIALAVMPVIASSSSSNDGRTAIAQSFATVEQAFAAARNAAVPGDRIVVFGSFFTAASALRMLQAQPNA